MGEYQARADHMDALLGQGQEEGGGRVRRQLDLYGELITIVVGKYLELSEGGQNLLKAMACSRVAKLERASGLASSDREREEGILRGEIRRQLSTVNLRATMSCLLDRLHQAGPGKGARLRNRRQEWMARQEERMAAEREGQWATRVRGHTLLRKGRILDTRGPGSR